MTLDRMKYREDISTSRWLGRFIGRNRFSVLAGLLLVLAGTGWSLSQVSSWGTTGRSIFTNDADTAAYELALGDVGNDASLITSEVVARYRLLMAMLADRYGGSVFDIADLTLAAKQRLKLKYGVDANAMRIMRGGYDANVSSELSYAELMAAYCEFRFDGSIDNDDAFMWTDKFLSLEISP